MVKTQFSSLTKHTLSYFIKASFFATIALLSACQSEETPATTSQVENTSAPLPVQEVVSQNAKADKANSLSPFILINQHNEKFTNDNLLNKWSLIFVGYTSCPDVCPTTMMELAFAYPELTQHTSLPVQVIMVSADPLRDSTEKLKNYIKYFNKDFIALRAEHDTLFPFVRSLGMIYSMVDEKPKDDAYYLVDHSASVALINPQGEIQALFKPKENDQGILSIDANKLIENFEVITSVY